MLSFNSIDEIICTMNNGCCITKCPMGYDKITTEIVVAGRLMGLGESDWWYVVESYESDIARGIIQKEQFLQLYRELYIREEGGDNNDRVMHYILNEHCDARDFQRYQHQINSWEQTKTSPDLKDIRGQSKNS